MHILTELRDCALSTPTERPMEVSLSGLVTEARDWRKHFSVSGLLTALVIGLAPSAWDIGADFRT